MYRILIVEDDAGIARGVAEAVAAWGMEASCVRDFRDVMAEFAKYSPHLVLMDIGLPFMNGYHWCTEIRKVSKVPILFLSSASDNMNIIMAMNTGADDFIAKPFDSSVLIAKIQALLRRAYAFGESVPILEHRGAVLNTGDGTLRYGDREITLSKNEFRILLVLMRSRGRTVSREKLMEALWQTDEFVDENALTVNVGRLRRKLAEAKPFLRGASPCRAPRRFTATGSILPPKRKSHLQYSAPRVSLGLLHTAASSGARASAAFCRAAGAESPSFWRFFTSDINSPLSESAAKAAMSAAFPLSLPKER